MQGATSSASDTPNRILTSSPAYHQREEPMKIEPDREKMSDLSHKYDGKRCFILGNGPSLMKTDVSKLKSEYTFGVNGIFWMRDFNDFTPTFYVVEDIKVMSENISEINNFDVPYKLFPTEYKHLITNHENTIFFNMNRGFYEPGMHCRVPRFSVDCSERIYCGQSVTIMNLQLAYYMGFSEIYLIGMDFNYSVPQDSTIHGNSIISNSADPNHFHPEYFGKGKTWHNPRLDMVKVNYELAELMFRSRGRKIFNATAGGKLDVFERVNFDSLF